MLDPLKCVLGSHPQADILLSLVHLGAVIGRMIVVRRKVADGVRQRILKAALFERLNGLLLRLALFEKRPLALLQLFPIHLATPVSRPTSCGMAMPYPAALVMPSLPSRTGQACRQSPETT